MLLRNPWALNQQGTRSWLKREFNRQRIMDKGRSTIYVWARWKMPLSKLALLGLPCIIKFFFFLFLLNSKYTCCCPLSCWRDYWAEPWSTEMQCRHRSVWKVTPTFSHFPPSASQWVKSGGGLCKWAPVVAVDPHGSFSALWNTRVLWELRVWVCWHMSYARALRGSRFLINKAPMPNT